MLCPLATYGRSHDKSSLFVWWVGNQTSTKKLLHKWCFAERLKIVFCCIYSVGFPIFQYVCSRWDFGNMEMPQLTSFSASQCHHVFGGSIFERTPWYNFEKEYVFHFFLAPSAWECLISPSSSRPLLYDANKISPSFMLALTRSHLSRAFVGVALSYTCSNLPAILCYLYCARGLPFVFWKCMKVTTWSNCSITTAIILTKGSQSVQALRAFKVQC